jgi:hypothetical protein
MTKLAIIDSARKLFSQQGYFATTVEDIAAGAQVAVLRLRLARHAPPRERVVLRPRRALVGDPGAGIQLFDHDRLIAVADSNRFTTGQAGTVSILDYHRALTGAGASATLGTFVAGDFPRQWGLSNDDRFLYLTEFSSNNLAVFPVRSLVNNVAASDPYLGFGSPFGPFGRWHQSHHLP